MASRPAAFLAALVLLLPSSLVGRAGGRDGCAPAAGGAGASCCCTGAPATEAGGAGGPSFQRLCRCRFEPNRPDRDPQPGPERAQAPASPLPDLAAAPVVLAPAPPPALPPNAAAVDCGPRAPPRPLFLLHSSFLC